MDYRQAFKIAYIIYAVVSVIAEIYNYVKTKTFVGMSVMDFMIYAIGYLVINTKDKIHNRNFYAPAIIAFILIIPVCVLTILFNIEDVFYVVLIVLTSILILAMIILNHCIYRQPMSEEDKGFMQMAQV